MPVREGPPQPAPPPKGRMMPVDDGATHAYPAEKARGAEIIMRTPARRFVFFAGLVAAFALALLVRLFA